MEYARAAILAVMLIGAFGLFAHTTFYLFRFVTMGRHQDMPVALGARLSAFVKYVLGQARVILEPAGVAHFFIFWGFLILQLETFEYLIRGFYWKFHFSLLFGDTIYNAMLLSQDLIGFAVLVAVSYAAVRRYGVRPKHAVISADAAIILGLIGGLMLTKFLANGAEIAMMPAEALGHDPAFTPIAQSVSFMLADGPGTAVGSGGVEFGYHVGYWLHVGIVLFFLNYIPFGKHLHLLGAMPNIFFRKLEPKGALYAIDMTAAEAAFERGEEYEFGAKEVEHLTWKQLLDTYAGLNFQPAAARATDSSSRPEAGAAAPSYAEVSVEDGGNIGRPDDIL